MDREGYRYAELLLRERQQVLDALDREYRGIAPPPGDYLSCRRSLLQAIDQLETLMQSDPKTEPASRLKE